MFTTKTHTLVGHRSFKAKLTRQARVNKYSNELLEPVELFEFSTEGAATQKGASYIHKDFTDRAKSLGHKPKTGTWGNKGWGPQTPNFTAAPATALEREWLGAAVRPKYSPDTLGHVVSLSPSPKSVWVLVGREFVEMRADSLTLVSAFQAEELPA